MAGSFTIHPRRFDRERAVSAAAVVAVHAALGYALLTGLGVSIPTHPAEVLAVFDVTTPPPPRSEPPPPRPRSERAPRKEGAAAPPNITSRATEIVAPVTPIPIPPPVTVTETPGTGAQATSGNAPIVGPGTGSGGLGEGTGSGRYGDGPGGGGGGSPAIPVRSSLGNLDCEGDGPDEGPEARRRCPSVEVTMRLTIDTNGRVAACRLIGPSGDRSVDGSVCDRARDRMRFRPARDAAGRKVAATITWDHYFDARLTVEGPDD